MLEDQLRVPLLYAVGHAGDYRKLVARAATANHLVALTSWPLTSIQKLV